MDTKLKNIKHISAKRIIAFVLAAVLFLTAGYAISMAVRGFFFYNGYEYRDYTQTTAFRWQLNEYIYDVIYEGKARAIDTLEEFLQTDGGKELTEEYEQRKNDVTNCYNLLKEKDITVYVDEGNRYRYTYVYNGLTYYFSYDGQLISKEEFDPNSFVQIMGAEITVASTVSAVNSTSVYTTIPTEYSTVFEVVVPETTIPNTTMLDRGAYYPYDGRAVPVEIKQISDALRTLNDISDFTCYGEVPLDAMLTQLKSMYDGMMVNRYSEAYRDTAMLNSVKRFNYFVVYDTGDVFTNCGLTADAAEEKILEKMGDVYVERYKDGKYTLVKGENPPEPTNLMGELHESLYSGNDRESWLSRTDFRSITDSVKMAYFGFLPATQPASEILDGFTLSEKGFHDFSRNPAFLKDTSTCLIIFFVTMLLASAACIYLLRLTGRTADGIKTYPIDRVPVEITSVLGIGIMILLAVAAVGLGIYESDPGYAYRYDDFINLIMYSASGWYSVITGLLVSAFFLIWTGLTSIVVRNARNKTFRKRTLCWWILHPLRWIWKKAKEIYRKTVSKIKFILASDYIQGMGKKFKLIACCSVAGFIVATVIYYSLAMLFCIEGVEELGFPMYVIGIIGDLAIILFALLTVVSLDRIMAAAAQMRNGNLNTQIDTTRMPPFMRRFADDILSMQDGLQNAVESAVKDQRMKAELITNVSHDLKTPLTSIVSYVDLLKKCDVQDETAQKYITVLDEKAARMKKLIEDLVEASKASTGAVEIHPVKINLCEFAAQAVGEHEDELKKFSIELVLRTPDKPVTVWADSQKTSRIVENLFSNIRKYAMEGTRVYVEVFGGSDYGTMVFKNISKYAIDVSADELTQRFVRGDTSRSGEGSGLGLSIAQNLCELQNGKFNVSVDGDLFKVTLELPAIK